MVLPDLFCRLWNTAVLVAAANYLLLPEDIRGAPLLILLAAAFLLLNLFPSPRAHRAPTARLRVCGGGGELLILFLCSATVTFCWHLAVLPRFFPQDWKGWLLSALVAFLVEAAVFWNGILRVYLTSVQLGLRWRVIGILLGWLPLLNLWALWRIIRTVRAEVAFEWEKLLQNEARKDQALCRTKYPLLLVHGVFFRDSKVLNYWGRIPGELQKNGAVIHYGNHQSAAAVADSGAELARRIREVAGEEGKVNIIAHSKGGLDCRWAISRLGMAPYVASLTTINTPHRGCIFVDYLLEKVPRPAQASLAAGYNAALRQLGDEDPDFMAAVGDLTASACARFNQEVPDAPGVFYQSVGSRLNRAVNGQFPMNFSHTLVKHFDGANDGLVAETSFPWGEKYTFLTVKGRRGISHGDVIDMNRENIPGFDVREFFVELVSDLRQRGF